MNSRSRSCTNLFHHHKFGHDQTFSKATVVLLDPEVYDELTKSAELSRTLMQIAKAKSEHEAGQGTRCTGI